ncbi:hypothetical protein MPNT_180039 [Candidatus Methylacidithermus pantelleriae]|uniref:Uncharacterized protein n=1 Tax=Candidatus Methylacidithermus pantelleriae TaxID=2744239 RepID=A0A8J2BNZ2_9BACT|nr:hypothetical protein MPNT_180039 [Candidatus Methylacidithermus pantelleriae]
MKKFWEDKATLFPLNLVPLGRHAVRIHFSLRVPHVFFGQIERNSARKGFWTIKPRKKCFLGSRT